METHFNTAAQQEPSITTSTREAKSIFIIFGQYLFKLLKIIFFAVIFFTLSFHWMPDHGHIFPKERLSFAHTIISYEDIDLLIERHNEASGVERALIRQEYIHQKMVELGVIFEKGEEE